MITMIIIRICDEILCEHWIFDGHNSLGKGSSRTWDRSGGASTKSWGYLQGCEATLKRSQLLDDFGVPPFQEASM